MEKIHYQNSRNGLNCCSPDKSYYPYSSAARTAHMKLFICSSEKCGLVLAAAVGTVSLDLRCFGALLHFIVLEG